MQRGLLLAIQKPCRNLLVSRGKLLDAVGVLRSWRGLAGPLGSEKPSTYRKERALNTALSKPDCGFTMFNQLYLYLKKEKD